MLTQAFTRATRPILGAAFLIALATLVVVGPARAERPGWYSQPTIVSGEAKVGSTLAGSDGSLRCDPSCDVDAGDDPKRVGRYFQWLSCADKHGGGKAAPAGGLPDEGGPCPGAVIIRPTINIRSDSRANFYTVRPEDAGRHIQMEVIAVNHDCGHPRSDGSQECHYVESHAWSPTIGPIIAPGPPPPPPPPPVTAPTYTALPEITGDAEDMQTLTVSNGTWNGTQPLDYEYKWLRCSRANKGCKEIEEATESTYTLTSADIGARITASVTVRNAGGSFTGIAKLTAKVAGAKPRPGRDSLGVDVLLAPRHHLRVQSVTFTPALLRPGGRWVARVTVTDARGFYISGAEVSVADELGDVTATPVLTNARGVATVRLRAARFLPLGRLVLEVTAASPENEELTTTKRVVVRVRR